MWKAFRAMEKAHTKAEAPQAQTSRESSVSVPADRGSSESHTGKVHSRLTIGPEVEMHLQGNLNH